MAIRFTREVRHEGLGKYRVISGTDPSIVDAKARALAYEWDQKYQLLVALRRDKQRALEEKQSVLEIKYQRKSEIEEKLQFAKERTDLAQQAVKAIRGVLKEGLQTPSQVDWERLKSHLPFSKPKPESPVYRDYPREPNLSDRVFQPELSTETLGSNGPMYLQRPPPPLQSHPKYQPQVNLVDKLIKSRMESKMLEAQVLFDYDYKAWEEEILRIDSENQKRIQELFNSFHANWEIEVDAIRKENEEIYSKNLKEVEQWNRESEAYQAENEKSDLATDELRAKYETMQPEGVEGYCGLVLAMSHYPESFPQDSDIEYNPDTKILIVEYALPAPEHLPRLKEIKFIKSKNEFAESYLSESELNKLYDDLLYQICLRSLCELFTADEINTLSAISFNGWVNSIDRATGKTANACVLSIQAKKGEFLEVNLENVDPKSCFRSLKGIGSSKLHSLTPVAPVLSISRDDKRFIASHEVESQLNEGFNLAAMDWEDFEHLIRQLFEEEFRQAGGEVKVTQASRDGGVDAIAFDPDVIRGGKTVIQAKRYTNTVGVSAVRDLYGTVLNEGASKGILVTTSDYGLDSYEFAKGKPLVLLSGANLLNLLAKHGHKAKIDLKEAKTILASQSV
jgi:restriction system protein